jgi:hypothetical protein
MLSRVLTFFSVVLLFAQVVSAQVSAPKVGYPPAPIPLDSYPSVAAAPVTIPEAEASPETPASETANPSNPMLNETTHPSSGSARTSPSIRARGAANGSGGVGIINGTIGHF